MALSNDQLHSTHYQKPEYQIIDNHIVRFSDIVVHEFPMGDVEDPDLYAGEPLWKWQNSEAGKWVMEHAVEQPYWIRSADFQNYGYRYKIVARLSEPMQTFFRLKFQ